MHEQESDGSGAGRRCQITWDLSIFLWTLSFVLNQRMAIPKIDRDSTSVISLVTARGGVMRTKHMIRFGFIYKLLIYLIS